MDELNPNKRKREELGASASAMKLPAKNSVKEDGKVSEDASEYASVKDVSTNTSGAKNNKHGRHSKAEDNVPNNDSLSNTMNNTTSDPVVQELRDAHQQDFRSIVEKLSVHSDLVDKTLRNRSITMTREIINQLVNIANTNGHYPQKAREALKRMRLNPASRDVFDTMEVMLAFVHLKTNAEEVDGKLHSLARLGQELQGGTITGATTITEGKSAYEKFKQQHQSGAPIAGDCPMLDGTPQSIGMLNNAGALSVQTLKPATDDKTMNNTTSDPVVQELRDAHQRHFRSTVEKLNCHADLIEKTCMDMNLTVTREVIDQLVNIANAHGHVPQEARERLERMRLDLPSVDYRSFGIVVNKYLRLQSNAEEVDGKLHSLARLGQELQGGTITGATTITEGETAFENYRKHYQSGAPLGGDCPILDGPWQSIAMFDDVDALSVETLKLGKTDKEWLQTKSRKFGAWLARGKIVYKGKKEDNEKAEWEENLKKGIDYLRADLKDQSELLRKENMYCPSMIALEDPGCQPAFEALMSSINHPEHMPEQPFSPPKYPEEKKLIPKGANRSACFVDFVLKKPGQYQLMMIDSDIELPIEIKPIFRQGQSPKVLEGQCENRVMGHLAKYIKQCFEFKAHGTPSFATGVIGTLAYIKVIQLHLVNDTATGKFDLEHKASKYLPLIAKKDFDKWWSNHDDAWKERKKKQYDKLVQKLYGDVDKGIIEGIPKGYLALWKMKNESRSSFFGPPWKDMFEVDDNSIQEPGFTVGEVLGHGACGLVIEAKRNNAKTEYVFKTSALSSDRHLSNERDVLEGLKQNRDSGESSELLTILEKEVQLNLQLGSLEKKVTALLLSPKGVPLINYLHSRKLLTGRLRRNKAAEIVSDTMEKALKHMHDKGFVHNDISPKNMIAIPNNNEELKVCLIDFGIASRIGNKPKYCVGTELYMHEEAFEAYPYGCESKKIHDHRGLSLSVTVILNAGFPGWSMNGFPRKKFRSSYSIDEMRGLLLRRKEEALEIIDKGELNQGFKDKLTGWLN